MQLPYLQLVGRKNSTHTQKQYNHKTTHSQWRSFPSGGHNHNADSTLTCTINIFIRGLVGLGFGSLGVVLSGGCISNHYSRHHSSLLFVVVIVVVVSIVIIQMTDCFSLHLIYIVRTARLDRWLCFVWFWRIHSKLGWMMLCKMFVCCIVSCMYIYIYVYMLLPD